MRIRFLTGILTVSVGLPAAPCKLIGVESKMQIWFHFLIGGIRSASGFIFPCFSARVYISAQVEIMEVIHVYAQNFSPGRF